ASGQALRRGDHGPRRTPARSRPFHRHPPTQAEEESRPPQRPGGPRLLGGDRASVPTSREESMVAHVDIDIAQVWRDYRAHPSIELRNVLVEHYLPLVKYNAERIWARLPDGVDLDDLISAGIFGLMDAIEAFDLDRGVKFETYCVPRI